MRVRITRQPSGTVDGVDLTRLLEGRIYDMGTSLATLLIVSQWAEPVLDDRSASVIPLDPPSVKEIVTAVDRDSADHRPPRPSRPRRRTRS